MSELGDQEGGGGWRGEVQEGGIPGPEPGEGQGGGHQQWGKPPSPLAGNCKVGGGKSVVVT